MTQEKFDATIDPRGRLKVPIAFEESMKSQTKWYVSLGPAEGSLLVTKTGERDQETEVDPQGRMAIPGKVLRLFKGQSVEVSWQETGLMIQLHRSA